MESRDLRISDAHWGLEPKSNVAAEVTRYTLSLSKGSDLFSDERARIE